MTNVVDPFTFKAASEPVAHSVGKVTEGTVEATLGGETRRVPAFRWDHNDGRVEIRAYGMTGRYNTGTKAWGATVTHDLAMGMERIRFGRDDRAAKFQKASALSFA